MKFERNGEIKAVYKALVEILSVVPPLKLLSPRELEFFAILLYYNSKYKEVPKDIRGDVLLATKVKKEMADILNISSGNITNLIKDLRKKKVLIDNTPIFEVNLSEGDSISIIWVLKVDRTKAKEEIIDNEENIQLDTPQVSGIGFGDSDESDSGVILLGQEESS